mmetsp:Transcript_17894/g.27670  ORF Transcript_17894/g.27670 Transcript_17894/m.27670 type:complete len:624 (+) Transcript_17894:263-2134(+)
MRNIILLILSSSTLQLLHSSDLGLPSPQQLIAQPFLQPLKTILSPSEPHRLASIILNAKLHLQDPEHPGHERSADPEPLRIGQVRILNSEFKLKMGPYEADFLGSEVAVEVEPSDFTASAIKGELSSLRLEWTILEEIMVDGVVLEGQFKFLTTATFPWKMLAVELKRLEEATLQSAPVAGQEQWSRASDRWKDWWPEAFWNASRTTIMLNEARKGNEDWGFEFWTRDADIDFYFSWPISVVNLPKRRDRRMYMEAMLPLLGFQNFEFPHTIHKDEYNLKQLVAQGLVANEAKQNIWNQDSSHGPVLAYIANALGQLEIIRRRSEEGHEFFGVFEDDIIPGISVRQANRRVFEAIEALPPSADMLYLEYCLEACSNISYSPYNDHLVRLHTPFCAASIVFTLKGARKILELCRPVWQSIDSMYAILTGHGFLEVYAPKPQIFFQDSFWGSDANRSTEQDALLQNGQQSHHALIATSCKEYMSHPVVSRAWILDYDSIAGHALMDSELYSVLEECGHGFSRYLTMKAFPLMDWAPVGTAKVMIAMSKKHSVNVTETGFWSPGSQYVVVGLDINVLCPHEENLCFLELYRLDSDGNEIDGRQVQVFLESRDSVTSLFVDFTKVNE